MRTIFLSFLFSLCLSVAAQTGVGASSTKETPEQYQKRLASAGSELAGRISRGQIKMANLDDAFDFEGHQYQVSQFRDVVENLIKAQMKGLKDSDRRAFLSNYLTSHSAELGDLETYKKGCPQTDSCEEYLGKRRNALANINTMYKVVYSRNSEELFERDVCAAYTPLIPNEDFWAQFTAFTKNTKQCEPLKPGEFRRVGSDGYQSDFLMRKTAEGKTQVVLNLDFKYKNGAATNVDMMNRLRSCLKDANPYLGPRQNGLEIVALTPDETLKLPIDQRPESAEVGLEGPNFRANSQNYGEEADCTTLTHEVLHLLGLCDEYEERDPALKERYSCRIITNTDSIMRDKDRAYDRLLPQTVSCDCSSDYCKTMMSSPDPNVRAVTLGETPLEIIDGWFDNDYCSVEDAFKPVAVPRQPDRATVVGDVNTDTSFTLRRQAYMSNMQLHAQEVTCTFVAKSKNPLIIAEELRRFQRSKEAILRRVEMNPMKINCPWGGRQISQQNKRTGEPGATMSGSVLTIRRDPERDGILLPNQLSRVLNAGCEKKARNYRRCADLAYSSFQDCDQTIRQSCSEDSFMFKSGDASGQ